MILCLIPIAFVVWLLFRAPVAREPAALTGFVEQPEPINWPVNRWKAEPRHKVVNVIREAEAVLGLAADLMRAGIGRSEWSEGFCAAVDRAEHDLTWWGARK